MSTKNVNNTVLIILLVIIAVIAFLCAKIHYNHKGTKDTEVNTKPKLFKYIIGVITAGATILGIYGSNLGQLFIGEFIKYKHMHTLVLEYPDDYIYQNTIESDISAIKDRINAIDAEPCGYKKNGSKIAILYKSIEELPDYIVDTAERLASGNIDGEVKALLDEYKLSTDLNIVYNGFGSRKYNEFVEEDVSNVGDTNTFENNVNEFSENNDDVKKQETVNVESKALMNDGQKDNVSKITEGKKTTGNVQQSKEKYIPKQEANAYKKTEILDKTDNPISNNAESQQNESTEVFLPPPEIDNYNLVEPPSLD